jgi:hypothetical protein
MAMVKGALGWLKNGVEIGIILFEEFADTADSRAYDRSATAVS